MESGDHGTTLKKNGYVVKDLMELMAGKWKPFGESNSNNNMEIMIGFYSMEIVIGTTVEEWLVS